MLHRPTLTIKHCADAEAADEDESGVLLRAVQSGASGRHSSL